MVKSCSRCRSAGATERSSPRPSCGPCITPAPRPSSGARQRRLSSRSRRISTPSIRKQVDDAPEEEVATRPLGKASNRRRRSLIVAPMSRCRIDPGRDAPRVVVSPAMPHHASLALRRGRHVVPVRTDLLIAGASWPPPNHRPGHRGPDNNIGLAPKPPGLAIAMAAWHLDLPQHQAFSLFGH
jgi:hypothetical protein